MNHDKDLDNPIYPVSFNKVGVPGCPMEHRELKMVFDKLHQENLEKYYQCGFLFSHNTNSLLIKLFRALMFYMQEEQSKHNAYVEMKEGNPALKELASKLKLIAQRAIKNSA
jgi:hypothetical protein